MNPDPLQLPETADFGQQYSTRSAPWIVEPTSRRWPFLVAVLIVVIAALFATQVAASRGAPDRSLHADEDHPTLPEALRQGVVPLATSVNAGTARLSGPGVGPAWSPAHAGSHLHIADLLGIRGTATWYCGHGSACTRGYQGSDLVAAIDPTLGIRKGSVVTVSSRGRAIAVTIVDVCACAGRRLIDLTSGAFARLAPLSAGVISISLEVGAGRLPPTDTEDSDD